MQAEGWLNCQNHAESLRTACMIGYRRTVSIRRALSLRFSHIRDSSTCPLSRLSTGHRPSHLPPSYRTQSRMRPNAFGSALMLSHVERAYAYAKATPTECPSIQLIAQFSTTSSLVYRAISKRHVVPYNTVLCQHWQPSSRIAESVLNVHARRT